MNRLLVVFVLTATIAGCRSSSCCRKPTCQSCAPPPVVLGSPPSARQPEILFPSAPPSSAPAPVPSFPPPPATSGYAPSQQYPPSRIANVPPPPPEIRLDKPEFSETSQRGNVSLKPVTATNPSVLNLQPTEVVAGKVATGRRPTLDDLDQLQTLGYRQLIDLGGGTETTSAKQVYANRAIELKTVDANDMTSRKVVGQAMNSSTAPVYVFADNPQILRAFWQSYYRENEHLSADAAKICAARLVP